MIISLKPVNFNSDKINATEPYVLAMLKKECQGTDIHVKGQASKRFWGAYKTIRPDIVLEKGEDTYIIDTKWKRPSNNQPSVEDLRQMYAYARFWDTEKVMLLYPGDPIESKFISYKNKNIDERDHQCKVAFVNVLEGRVLDKTIGRNIRDLIE